MVFMTFKTIIIKNYDFLTSRFLYFFFVNLLPSLNNIRSHVKFLSLREGKNAGNLMFLKNLL